MHTLNMCMDPVLLPASFAPALSASPAQFFRFFLFHHTIFIGPTASSCQRMRHTCRCWTVTHFQPPPACFNTLALSVAKTHKHTEAVLKWLSQAALEPWKCSKTKVNYQILNGTIPTSSLDTKKLISLFFFCLHYWHKLQVSLKLMLESSGQAVGEFFFSVFVSIDLKVLQGHWLGRLGL